jgi:putative ABC transport system permease protein
MVVAVLYNTGNLSFHERLKEFATLKVLGFSSKKIRSLITRQNAVLSVIGIILGAPFGKPMLEAMMNSNGENFDYYATVTPVNYLLAGLTVLIVSMAVSLMFTKKIRRLDMVESLKGAE